MNKVRLADQIRYSFNFGGGNKPRLKPAILFDIEFDIEFDIGFYFGSNFGDGSEPP